MIYFVIVNHSLDSSNFNITNVTEMKNMFYCCKSLTNLNIFSFNTKNVIKMVSKFTKYRSLNSINVTNFNTNNVIQMKFMFYHCFSLKNLIYQILILKKKKKLNGCLMIVYQ